MLAFMTTAQLAEFVLLGALLLSSGMSGWEIVVHSCISCRICQGGRVDTSVESPSHGLKTATSQI
ncbi:hypothetical protein FRX31_034522 [Thalictrum thalictroides]|uniref:Transmembrane protein n=1 Tax=Thalictrum thalictroides TaxID=46969 RepID=A0A7J6UUH4_THATH|nr:hypothetical protein FRX31_034522 [Thalictrum thalictroides]